MPSRLLLLLVSTALTATSIVQTISYSQLSPAEQTAVSALSCAIKAGDEAIKSVQDAQATDPAASAVSAYIATAVPSSAIAQQTANFEPIVYPLVTEVPFSLRAYESSAIAAQSSVYYAQVSPVVSQYVSLFSDGVQNLSSVLATESPPPVSTMSTAVSSAGAGAAAASSSSIGAGVTQAPGKVLGVVAGVIAGMVGIVGVL